MGDEWQVLTVDQIKAKDDRAIAIRPFGSRMKADTYVASGVPVIRGNVLALDPGVTEEVLKLYIAFKAETNFVDVVPQKSRLRLSLNMAFHELHDPKGLAKDVTNLGRWGNGDIEVGLSTPDQLPYVMGLVRQSFEKQMSNGGAE